MRKEADSYGNLVYRDLEGQSPSGRQAGVVLTASRATDDQDTDRLSLWSELEFQVAPPFLQALISPLTGTDHRSFIVPTAKLPCSSGQNFRMSSL